MPTRFAFLWTISLFLSTSAQAQPQEVRTLWDHNGSVMYLIANGSSREFYYQKPRAGMLEAGAHPDALLFKGQINDGQISGTAYIFNAQCGQVPFEVKGPILDNGGRIMLTGQAPHVGRNCRAYGNYTSTLEFRLLKTAEIAQPQAPPAEQPSSGAAELGLSTNSSAQATRTAQTPTSEESKSNIAEPHLRGNTSSQTPPTAQTPTFAEPKPESKSSAGELKEVTGPSVQPSPTTQVTAAQDFWGPKRLAPVIIAMNVVFPLLSVLSLIVMLKSSG
jgi:hypothetical protein